MIGSFSHAGLYKNAISNSPTETEGLAGAYSIAVVQQSESNRSTQVRWIDSAPLNDVELRRGRQMELSDYISTRAVLVCRLSSSFVAAALPVMTKLRHEVSYFQVVSLPYKCEQNAR